MEKLWSQTYALIVSNWHKTLAAIEPTFIKFVHYVESIVWSTGQKVLDFLYITKNELIDSPYFVKLANFTRDVDQFYKDITGNNTIGSVVKYTKIAWNFLKEKYFNTVPFGKELQQIIAEITNELSELKKLPLAKFLIQKYDETYEYLEWWYDYLDINIRIQRLIILVRQKLIDMSMTALEADNK